MITNLDVIQSQEPGQRGKVLGQGGNQQIYNESSTARRNDIFRPRVDAQRRLKPSDSNEQTAMAGDQG